MHQHQAKQIKTNNRMDPEQADRYLRSKEYLIGSQPNSLRLRGEAVELAVNLRDSFSQDFRQYFIACQEAGEYGACYSIIQHLFEVCNVQIPMHIRAFASNQEVWREYLRITADHLSILASTTEGEPFP